MICHKGESSKVLVVLTTLNTPFSPKKGEVFSSPYFIVVTRDTQSVNQRLMIDWRLLREGNIF